MKTKNMPKWKTPMIVFGIFSVFILALFIQYCYLSLAPKIYGIDMDEFAANRNTYSTRLYSKRGTIYDNDGNTLALDVSAYTVVAYLSPSRTGDSETLYHVADVKATAEALAPILDMEVSYLEELMSQDKYQVELGPGGRGITEIKKSQIEKLQLPGIDFVESFKRFYPNGDFASYIIGYAKKKDIYDEELGKYQQQIVGEMGIEDAQNDLLKGTNGYLKYQQDRYGYKIPDTKEERLDAKNGSDIYLTIDSNIQRMVESTVDDGVEKFDPDWITINVMDAKTGDILASSASPSFDPNVLEITNYENPLTSFVYEPGSVMKIFTYMCAIDKGTYKGDDTYESGSIKIDDRVISDWNKVGWGNITFDYGFQMSSNVGVSYITQRFIDKNDLHDCLERFGFGNQTGIDLPRELMGSIKFNVAVETAAAAYGQGISTTPIQQLQALSIIANNGKMLKPHIISKIVDSNTGEITYERKVEESSQVVKESTVEYIRKLMYNTVNDFEGNATGTYYHVDGLDVIGKTGTAEIFDNETNSYLQGYTDYTYSFSGMFPKDDPQIIVFISMRRSNNGNSSSLGTIMNPLIQSIAKYKGLLSSIDEDKTATIIEMPSYINKNKDDVVKDLEKKNIKTLILGDGDKIINQYPKANSNLLSTETVYLVTNSQEYKMPNLKGFSRLEVSNLLEMINLDYEFEEFGYVEEQSIEVDEVIKFDKPVVLKLKPKYEINE